VLDIFSYQKSARGLRKITEKNKRLVAILRTFILHLHPLLVLLKSGKITRRKREIILQDLIKFLSLRTLLRKEAGSFRFCEKLQIGTKKT